MVKAEERVIREAVRKVCGRFALQRSDAEELFQEVSYRFIKAGKPMENLHAWAFRCAQNFVISAMRKKGTFQKHAPRLYSCRIEDPLREVDKRELKSVAKSMVESLPPRWRPAVKKWLDRMANATLLEISTRERGMIFKAFRFLRHRFPKAKLLLS